MKILILQFLFSFLLLFFASCNTGNVKQDVNDKSRMMPASSDTMPIIINMREYYTCTMHLQIKSNKPGKCPICKMDLVKKQVDSLHGMTPIGNDSLKH
jgi:hypothetical protein